MAKWEMTEPAAMIPVAVEHYDKILEEVAELIYRHVCKSEADPLGPIQQKPQEREFSESGKTENKRRLSV